MIVVPAYGRDYATAQAALAAWYDGKDFQISDISSPDNGRYCSIRDHRLPKIRYNKLRSFVQVPQQ